MTTWHQGQPLKRAIDESKKTGVFIHPWSHPTMWQVVEDPPGRMVTGCGKFNTAKDAYAEALKGNNRYVIPPKG